MGIHEYEEPHDSSYSGLASYLASIRQGKPLVAPTSIGISDAQSVIYGSRSVDGGQQVFWPKK